MNELVLYLERLPLQIFPTLFRELIEIELTLPQFGALSLLSRGPRRAGDIADHLKLSHSATTNLLDRLEEKDLIKREHSSTDRRVVTCSLTSLGKEYISFVSFMNVRAVQHLASTLDVKDLETIRDALQVLDKVFTERQRELVSGGLEGAGEDVGRV